MKSLNIFLKESYWDKYQSNTYQDLTKNIIYDYVTGSISGVNDNLRKNNTRGCKDVISKLDKSFIEKSKIDVYRTIDWDYMINIYGVTKDNIDDFIGKVFINKGYMSTSKLKKSPWGDWGDYELLLHITSNKPVPCIDINSMFKKDEIDSYYQQELLLPRDLKMELVDYDIEGDLYVLDMKII